MPIPAGTTWVSPSYFGRGVFGGMVPFWKPLPDTLPEFTRGLLPREVAEVDLFAGSPLCRRMANGASLGLAVPHVAQGTRIRLTHLHPRIQDLVITLPGGTPRIAIDGREGALLPTEPVVHHVEIEPDLDRVSIVWRGAGPARRAYHPTELARMPFRVEWPEGM